jgi:hypothetical protein
VDRKIRGKIAPWIDRRAGDRRPYCRRSREGIVLGVAMPGPLQGDLLRLMPDDAQAARSFGGSSDMAPGASAHGNVLIDGMQSMLSLIVPTTSVPNWSAVFTPVRRTCLGAPLAGFAW